jgi:CheY-like chemotaxis protein
MKFTEHGGVTLRVRRLPGTSERVTLGFVVQDTGIGILAEVQARLFAPFAQADASITRRFGGTGLGLSIVKRLVDLMGGKMSLKSTPGVGSEFTIVLDFALASPEALVRLRASPDEPGEHALLGVRVLVVDDSDVNLDVTKRILELKGAQVWLASNGQEAFERIQAEPQGIDVVLMDVQMPILDGHGATQRIRRELGLADLPIIALTADALSSERQRASAAGMDDYIVKPFDAHALVGSILRHIRPRRSPLILKINGTGLTPVQIAAPWPEIEGIDSKDARERLVDDFALFRSMLKRLLDEFTNVAIPAVTDDAVTLASHAGRMHKLRGSAGMLGARAIQQLAGEAESACGAGDVAGAGRLTTALTALLQRLQQSAAPVLATDLSETEVDPSSEGLTIEPQALADFIVLLRQQSLSALDRFSSISSQLRGHLGLKSYERVRRNIENLQFSDAADSLEQTQT